MQIGGYKLEPIAKYYIESTSSGNFQVRKTNHGQRYASASDLRRSPEFQKEFTACALKD